MFILQILWISYVYNNILKIKILVQLQTQK